MTAVEPTAATVTKTEARKLLDALNGAKQRLLLDIGQVNTILSRIHETGAHLALGWTSWSQFCDEQGMERSASYRAVDHGQALRMLESAGAKVRPSAVSKAAAKVIVGDPSAVDEIAAGVSVREAVNRRRPPDTVRPSRSAPIVVAAREMPGFTVEAGREDATVAGLQPSVPADTVPSDGMVVSLPKPISNPVEASIVALLMLLDAADVEAMGRMMTVAQLDAVSMAHDVLTTSFYEAHPRALSSRSVPPAKIVALPVQPRSVGSLGRRDVSPLFKAPKGGKK